MPLLAIIFGLILDILGIAGFIATGAKSMTALIPAVIGTLIFLCGILAKVLPDWRKHVMHVAVLLGLLGTVAAFMRSLPKLPALLAGQEVQPSAIAVWLQFSFGAICLIFLVLCIRSFINARKAMAKAAA